AAVVRAEAASWRGDPMAAHRIWIDAAELRVEAGLSSAGYPLYRAVEAAWFAADFDATARVVAHAERLGLEHAEWIRLLATAAAGLNRHGGRTGPEALNALRKLIDVHDLSRGGFSLRDRALTTWLHLLVGDHTRARDLAAELVRDCRELDGAGVLPRALTLKARSEFHMGMYGDASADAAEAMRLGDELGQDVIATGVPAGVLAQIAAVRGEEERCRELVSAVAAYDGSRGIVRVDAARAVLDLGLGRCEDAVELLCELAAGPKPMEMTWQVPDLVEAAVRTESLDRVAGAFEWFADYALATGHAWAEALVERCRGLTASEADAGVHYARAAQLHRRPGDRPFERARTELLYGEWLRRARRPADARVQLRSAVEIFDRLGARPWARRARAELRAAGESVSDAAERPGRLTHLTPQELQVVRLAADGLTNRDIGARLFLSPRTVGYHLYKAYPKLGVASRAELARLPLA
ncbi:MAG: helix-turn-helix transcriptional regulator, partial [Stackebrandtia sp.]